MYFFHYTRSPVLQPRGLPLAISRRADANARIVRGRRDQQGQVIGLRAGAELLHLGENRFAGRTSRRPSLLRLLASGASHPPISLGLRGRSQTGRNFTSNASSPKLSYVRQRSS